MAKQNKGRKFFAASATAALVASAIVPVASAAQVNDYNKISGYAKEAVQSLVDAGVIQGDTNGNFNPLNTVTRAQAAEIFTKALELEADGDVNFSDVKKGAWYYNSIAAVVANGIFEGVSANEFAPNKSLTRSEAAKVLVDAFGLEGSESLSQFADASQVKPWAKSALETAVANGIFTGSEENGKLNLKPNAAITRQDFAVVFARTLDLVDAETPVDASVKAINNTTVEVTFDEEVDTDNVKAENFTIEGLKVTNASVKQTNKKVVVLTTEAQTADKDYALSYKGEEIGKFKGVAAVIPTAVKLTTASEQGVIGKEVTLKATVTVPEGQSKENVPVTFNIVNDKNTNEKIEKVAYTNAEGVATYSYTRYYASVDSATAYATDKSTVFSSAKVYWANEIQLAITEKTADNVLANGAKKVYEINAPSKAGQYVFVAFENNLGVTTDKLTRSVYVEGTGLWTQNATNNITETPATTDQYPYEITNGANRVVPVLLDSKGKANLVLSGTNGKVKPVVYAGELKSNYNFFNNNNPGSKITDFANILYNPTALQAKAAEVSFEIKHTLGLTIEAKGVANAAVAIPGTKQTGGRDYVATYVDKDGKPAKAGDVVYVALPYDAKHVTYLVDADGKQLTAHSQKEGYTYYQLAVKGKEGKVEFTVTSTDEQAWAEPIVFINNGTGPDAVKTFLDASDLQAKGAATYFTKEIQFQAELEALDSKGDETKSVLAGGSEFVEYKYNLLDQNGKPRAFTSATNVTFNVTAGTSDLTVTGANEGTVTVTPGNPRSLTTTIAAGELSKSIKVTADKAGSVTAYATASRVGAGVLPSTDSKTVVFAATSNVVKTGKVTKVDKEVVYIDGVPYSLTDATYLNNGAVVPTLAAFKADYLKDGATVTVSKDSEGKLTFNVVPASTGGTLVDKVNAATTGAQVQAAILELPEFKALTATQKTTAVSDILTLVQAGAVTEADIYGKLINKTTTTFALGTPNTYTAAVAAVKAEKATGTDAAAIDIKLTAKADGIELNGYTVTIVDTNKDNPAITVTRDDAAKTIELDLANTAGNGPVNSTIEQVITELGKLGLDVETSIAKGNFATALEGANVLLAGGKVAEAAKAATVELTFTESVSAKAGDTVSLTVTDGATDFIVAGTVASVADEKVKITLASTPVLATGNYTLKSETGLNSFVNTVFTSNAEVIAVP